MSSQTLFLADSIYTQVLISVWLWNFKDGGSLKARFLSKHQHNQRNKNPSMTCSSSKSAKIVLSKSIFYAKNQKFIQEYQFRRPFFGKNIFFWNHFIF